MSNRKEIFYLLAVIALLAWNIVGQVQHKFLRNTEKNLRLHVAHSSYIKTLQGQSVKFPDDFHSHYVLVIYFSIHDCPSCLDEHTVWNSLVQFYPDERLKVIGIIHESDMSDLLMSGFTDSLLFEVYIDAGQLRQMLAIEETPAKLLFNRRALQFVDTANPTIYSQNMFEQTIKSIVGYPFDNSSL
jgi:hypothetical protein